MGKLKKRDVVKYAAALLETGASKVGQIVRTSKGYGRVVFTKEEIVAELKNMASIWEG